MYKYLLRPLLFLLDPEKVHLISTRFLSFSLKLPLIKSLLYAQQTKASSLERKVFGLDFKNPVGLAAGFDKNATLYKDLDALGFGFIEIGTITPKAQVGNPKKRLFRLKEDHGIINRMGFNNLGVLAAVEQLKKNKGKNKVLIGGNIGKNKTTPNEKAVADYLFCFEQLFDYVDYFVVNVSSPNTPNLRDLQEKEPLSALLQELQEVNRSKTKPKPILLKISPDLSKQQLDDIIDIVKVTQIAGLIATNTTLNREGLLSNEKTEGGGLSGKPLTSRSTEVIRYIHEKSNGAFPIIGVGGIHSPQDALDKLAAGASLIQLYTGFIYEGPALIEKIKRSLVRELSK